MPFKPLSHLARVSIAKGLFHTGPSVVAAGQYASTTASSSINQIHNYPVGKFAKATHLQNVFQGASSSSGAGAKTGHATSGSTGDAGLATYFAAWQHAQQTGDDTELREHQFQRRIGWKSSERPSLNRLDSKAVDILRPAPRSVNRPYSENAAEEVKQAQDSLAEAEALAKVDAAIAQEIRDVRESKAAEEAVEEDTASSPHQSTSTNLTSPSIDESAFFSQQINNLAHRQQYVDIPAVFESMLRDGLVPTVEAYNDILVSAIALSDGTYQVWPRALEVYSDMTKRTVEPNSSTYSILVQFLTLRGLEAFQTQKGLELRRSRYANADGDFIFKSTALQQELYAGDKSTLFAIKLYNVAKAKLADFALSAPVYNALVQACAQEGLVEDMATIVDDMRSQGLAPASTLYPVMVNAYASVKDVNAAKNCYEKYRNLAIMRATNDPQDFPVYAALIKAYLTSGLNEAGLHFYEKIVESYDGAADEEVLTQALTAALVIDAIVPFHLEKVDFAGAIESINQYSKDIATMDQAFSKVCIAAADANEVELAQKAFSSMSIVHTDAAMALAAMYARHGQIDSAREVWRQITALPVKPEVIDFVAMLVATIMNSGRVEAALAEARLMFKQVRAFAGSRTETIREIDEAILLFGELMTQQHAVVSAQGSINLIRTMIENGGLVTPIAEHAIASLGPDCVMQLAPQDIALALHVQAGMLPAQPGVSDPAHAARFCHLLETVLNRGIAMDPSTMMMVTEALPRLHGARADLSQRWQELLQPPVKPAAIFSPVATSPVEMVSADAYDPYAHNTDYRASTIISDQLESTTGRVENQLTDALARFRNVRRAGRHVRYTTYAKLITAAGKTKQTNLIHEIFGMAQSDVPFVPEYPSVKAGWIPIIDSMVAAFLTVGDRKAAAKYHQDLLNMGAAPSANTFGIYITTLEGTFDEATEAVKIFQRALSEGVEPSVFLYNAVIGKLGKARRIDDCLFYFGDMQAKNIRPSSVTYGTLVNALCRTSEERFAEEMFNEMESMPNYRPRAAPYNSIIQYFLNTKRDRVKVLEYYERMKMRGIKPTSHTYKLLIEANASLEPINLSAAEAILEEMRVAGIQPEAVHYGTLIHAKGCVMHDMNAARATFDSVVANGSIRVTDNLYQNLLESMVANHLVAETDAVLNDMRARRVSMTPYIANTLIHGWAGEGDIDKAKSIYESLGRERREPSTYEAMTRAYLAGGDQEGARGVVKEMLSKGYPSAVAEKVLVLVGGT
jgi:pentatricopeptide repeat protein